MSIPVAPGKDGFNLLSAKGIYRVVLLLGNASGDFPVLEGPLVLESEDGAYRCEMAFADARETGDHLIFDFTVPDRKKSYRCFMKDDPFTFIIKSMPLRMGGASDGK
jgi:hypothetical protein